MIKAKRSSTVFLPVLLIGLVCASSCENDINKIREISAKLSSKKVQRTTGVDVIYSDSAKVKARVLAPLMLEFPEEKKPYELCPKGVTIYVFNDSLKVSATIVADSAVNRLNEKVTELYKNVVVKNNKGETFRSDELIWDQEKKICYSNKLVNIRLATGTIMNGTSFSSNETFTHWTMQQSNGIIHVDQDLTQ
jgi:LPS export ABC transporter protein LptC